MKTAGIFAIAALTLMACNQEQVQQTTSRAQNAARKIEQKVSDTFDVSAPLGAKEPPMTPQELEKQRFDQQWRQLQSFRAQQAAQAVAVQHSRRQHNRQRRPRKPQHSCRRTSPSFTGRRNPSEVSTPMPSTARASTCRSAVMFAVPPC